MDIQKQSKGDKAERIAGIASDIFNYAQARGRTSNNPVVPIKSQLAKYHYKHRPAVTTQEYFAKLLQDIETLEVTPNTINNLRLLALLFVRNGDIRTCS